MDIVFQLLLKVIWAVSILFFIYGLYHAVTAVIGLRKQAHVTAPAAPKHRFLVLIVARNEGLVIGNLIDSLKRQNYPPDMFDILVVPNNCSDQTAEISAAHGARILTCTEPVRSKGEAMSFAVRHLPADLDFDAYINFDADNIAHPDFLLQMNHALCQGATVAQGYRDTKNPHDTFNTACWALNYWFGARFFNHPRSLLRLSAMINGTGVMIRRSVIEQLGGWETVTLADDFALAIQCILAGEKVSWVPDAITYDEQSLTFAVTWKQRKRWLTGFNQAVSIYFGKILRKFIRDRKASDLDFLLYCLSMPVQYASTFVLPLGVILRLVVLKYPLFPLTPLYDLFLPSLVMSIAGPIAIAFLVAILEKKLHVGLLKGILMFPLFVAATIPIGLLSLIGFRNNFRWVEIRHTRSMGIDDLHTHRPTK